METLKKRKKETPRYSPSDYFVNPCETGDLACLELGIDVFGLDVNSRTSKGKTPLYIACKHGQLAAVDYLINRGADIRDTCLFKEGRIRGNTCLIGASKGGHHELINYILTRTTINVNSDIGHYNRTALHYAAQRGHLLAVLCLINHGADVNAEDSMATTVLGCACRHGGLDVIKVLLQKGAKILNEPPASVALCEACEAGHLEIVKFLVTEVKKERQPRDFGFDALTVASYHGRFEIVKWLIENGINTTGVTEKYDTIEGLISNCEANEAFDGPLAAACNRGHLDIAKYLVDVGCVISHSSKKIVYPFFQAALGGQYETLRFLLERFEFVTDPLDPPLCAAVIGKNLKVTELLIDKGACVNARDWCGKTPLHIACEENDLEQAKLLLKHGADPLACDVQSENAIHAAVFVHSIELVKEVTNGLSPESISALREMGDLPLQYAVEHSDFDIIRFLVEEKGADPNDEACVWPETDKKNAESSWEIAFVNIKTPGILFPFFIQSGHLPTRSIFARMSAKNQVPELRKAFFGTWEAPSLNLLLAAREKNPGSPFSKEYLPLDMFKEIFKATRQACLEFEWDSRYGEQ